MSSGSRALNLYRFEVVVRCTVECCATNFVFLLTITGCSDIHVSGWSITGTCDFRGNRNERFTMSLKGFAMMEENERGTQLQLGRRRKRSYPVRLIEKLSDD